MSIGKYARELILADASLTNDAILALVKQKFPVAKTTYACIAWYKSDMRKKGLIAKRVVTVENLDEQMEQLQVQLQKLQELKDSLVEAQEPQEEVEQ
jgi:hypothetical protein